MSGKYYMILDGGIQTSEDISFIGGKPKLPQGYDMPCCTFCDAEQTFFFQPSRAGR